MKISRVLRDEGDSQYQEQVFATIRELDYLSVRSTLQNRHVKTNVIGALLDGEFVFETYIGYKTFGGLTHGASNAGYDLLMLQPSQHKPLEKQKLQVLDRRCDGFIFVTPYERPEILELLVEHGFPAVTCYSNDVPEGVAWVVPDNERAVQQAVDLVLKHGHRKIAYWSADSRHSDARERKMAYQQAIQAHGLNSTIYQFPCNLNGADTDAHGALDVLLSEGITAVICHNDERALALWGAASERGLRIPEDLSLVGIDDMPAAAERGLTTFTNSFRTIGSTAAMVLISLLQGAEVEECRKRIPMPLVERSSVAPPKVRV